MSRDPPGDFPALPAVETLHDPLYAARGVTLGVLRLDRLHPLWGGNKVFKLLPNLRRAEALGQRRVISFGGAYSNHLHALAAWGREHGLETVGIVRGEAPARPGPTLRDLHDWGMRVRHVSRAAYRRRVDAAWVEEITRDLRPALVIPEGGDNAEGFAGCRELGRSIAALPGNWDVLALACGTGTTLAGLVAGGEAFVLGIAALRDARGIAARAEAHLATVGPDSSAQSTVGLHSCGQIRLGPDESGHLVRMNADPPIAARARFLVLDRFAGQGFARVDAQLARFMAEFTRRSGVPLEPVYTGKLFLGLHTLVGEGRFAPGTRVLALHTGGLQGARGASCGRMMPAAHAVPL
ncbi:MAG: pyridoxal-phosphate dependent enzyme [Pseudomonadales bacterium]|nr:pyridoxal-phosphate dependent enzyme [Pseudomonadales bacterium]